MSVSIYYGTPSNIREKSYCRLNLLRASVFNYERLDILRDSIGHPSKKLLSFEFAQCFCFQLRASRYITGLNWTSESKVIVVWFFSDLQFSILSVSIYSGHNRTSESKVIDVWICWVLLFSILSVSIFYGALSNIRVKSYCRLIFVRASLFNYERLDILRDSIWHPSQNLLSFKFAESFCFQFRAFWYMTGLNRTSEAKVIVVWIFQSFCFQFCASRYTTRLNRTFQ